ncbi:MAG: hypothetical protein ACREV6_21755 [Clostridium sp.]
MNTKMNIKLKLARETREYVKYLLKNYNEILKDIEQLKYEYRALS